VEASTCIEVDQDDLAALIQRKPHAGMDMLAVLGRHLHAAHLLARTRSTRNPNELIEEESTFGERIADRVAQFGGSWRFIILFGVMMLIYVTANHILGGSAWDPYPFILLNLVLSFQAAYASPIIMMSQNRQSKIADRRNQLDLQINLLAEQESTETLRLLRRLCEAAGIDPQHGRLDSLEKATRPEELAREIDRTFVAKPFDEASR
jgi:CRP/FNR family cyclic AMP-dependent transcriptional regulator